MNDLTINFGLPESALGYLTSTVQFGFITGTLVFALLSIADRFAPSKVFFFCAASGALFNLLVTWPGNSYTSLLIFRFLTGFSLAGIYPVGMKIAADYYDQGLGKSLGYLVGALVVGTAFPHLLKEVKGSFPWEFVLVATTLFALLGGILMVSFVPNGPFRKAAQKIDLLAIPTVFKKPTFRAAAFGYFGHMWELYTFWTFVPILLQMYNEVYPGTSFNVLLLSFVIIGIGGLACIIGGYLAQQMGTKYVAAAALLSSGVCCILLPLVFLFAPAVVFVLFLLFWGMVVVADSPLFSTLVAQNAPADLKGTALTIVNCLGFSLTIISILLTNKLMVLTTSPVIFTALAVGPLLGLLALRTKNTPDLT